MIRQTVGKEDILFAMDTNLPDRIYLGAKQDFDRAEIALVSLPNHEVPLMYPKNAQTSNDTSASIPATTA